MKRGILHAQEMKRGVTEIKEGMGIIYKMENEEIDWDVGCQRMESREKREM